MSRNMLVPASVTPATSPAQDGLDVLDLCHRHMIFKLGKLSALISRLAAPPDDEAREMAADLVDFFAVTVRQHHEDEQKHVPAAGGSSVARVCHRRRVHRSTIVSRTLTAGPAISTTTAAGMGCAS